MSIELDESTARLIGEIRETRARIVQNRMRGTIARYPEIGNVEIKHLTDEQIIWLALDRERAHQVQVEKDMQK
jgi:hypothetical protein